MAADAESTAIERVDHLRRGDRDRNQAEGVDMNNSVEQKFAVIAQRDLDGALEFVNEDAVVEAQGPE